MISKDNCVLWKNTLKERIDMDNMVHLDKRGAQVHLQLWVVIVLLLLGGLVIGIWGVFILFYRLRYFMRRSITGEV